MKTYPQVKTTLGSDEILTGVAKNGLKVVKKH